MKMKEALWIIEGKPCNGFMVAFERVEGSILVSDHFPDVCNGEPAFDTEEEAWKMAQRFAAETRGRCVNVYVVRGDFKPVPGYLERFIGNR